MSIGAFPVGAAPVAAGAVFTIIPILLSGAATLNTSGSSQAKILSPLSAGVSQATTTAQAKAKATAQLSATAELATSAEGFLGQISSLKGTAQSSTTAQSSIQSRASAKATATLVTTSGATLSSGPSLIKGSALNVTSLAYGRAKAPVALAGSSTRNLTGIANAGRLGLTSIVVPIFPTLPPLAWSVHKKPIMASRVTIGTTGRENQLAGAVYPRWAFTLTYGGNSWLRERTQNIVPDPTKNGFTEFEQLTSIFIFLKGPEGEFFYEDPDDNSRAKAFVGLGNGSLNSYPIMVPWGSGPFSPAMSFPVGGVNVVDAVYFDNSVQSTMSYSLDANRTTLIFGTPPPTGVTITMDFSFYYRCRFLDDHLEFLQFAKNLWECKEVRFESVKP